VITPSPFTDELGTNSQKIDTSQWIFLLTSQILRRVALDYYKIPSDILTGDWPPDWVRLRLALDSDGPFFLHSNIGPLHKTGHYRGFYADIGDLVIRIKDGLDSYPNGLYILCKSHL
jgi:hypothetical protein